MMVLLIINGEKNLFYYSILFVIAILCAACYTSSIALDIKVEHTESMYYKQEAAEESINSDEEEVEPLGDYISWEKYESLNPITKGSINDLYERYLGPMIQRFGFERVFKKYNYSLVVTELSALRPMKRNFAEMAFEDATDLEKLFGYEYITLIEDYEYQDDEGKTVKTQRIYDLENDFPSVFYYSGYVGFAIYMLFLAYFVGLILVAVITRFKRVVNIENGALLITLGLLAGAAQYSANVLRRPNASIYLSVILAYIYYNTAIKENVKYSDIFKIFKKKNKTEKVQVSK